MTANLTQKMIHFYQGSLHDINHFLKVTAFARTIGLQEQLDERTQLTLELTAIVHDIACPLCREKYGRASGDLQEQESEALLRPFLAEFNLDEQMRERVIHLVTHHHTYTGVDGMDWQILLEADFLVNACEGNMTREAIESFRDNVFRTPTGITLLNTMYLN
ncbi:MAG: HD domain-containing protein [bacterium]|nr:HD domain-containing protein [bacterium]